MGQVCIVWPEYNIIILYELNTLYGPRVWVKYVLYGLSII